MHYSFNARRRSFMHAVSAGGLTIAGAGAGSAQAAATPGDPWLQAQAIVDRLADHTSFRKVDFLVTKYGAAPCKLAKVKAFTSFEEQETIDTPAPGAKDCYAAFRAAIEACHKAGGGRVLIPAGDWYCAGPIVLLSNVHVHLAKGAHLYFSANPADYAKYGDVDCGANGKLVRTRWQSNDCLNFASMIYAYGQDNIAFTGEDWTSVIDGQAGVPFPGSRDCWWSWKGKNPKNEPGAPLIYTKGSASQITENPLNLPIAQVAPELDAAQLALIAGSDNRYRTDEMYLPALSEAGVPLARRVFGLGHYLRPSMVHIVSCTNVLLQGYQVQRTPFWQHHPVHCRNLVIRKVHAFSLGPNNDGFDPEACDHVLVDQCTFDTGDDCIAIKAGKNLDTQLGPSQNIVIQGCTMQSGHGAVTLGSEMAGGIQNVYAQNLVFQNAHWATDPLNTAIRLKTNMNRGGYLRNFYVRNVSIPNGVSTAPQFYPMLPGSPIEAKSVAVASGAIVTFDCDYTPRADNVRNRPPQVSNVHISNVKVGNVTKGGKQISCWQAVVILGPVAANYNGTLPAPPVPPVSNVTITDCDFGTPGDMKQPVFIYNVKDLVLKNVTIGGVAHNETLSA